MKNAFRKVFFASSVLMASSSYADAACNNYCRLWEGCYPNENIATCSGNHLEKARRINYIADAGGFARFRKNGVVDVYAVMNALKSDPACNEINEAGWRVQNITPSCIGVIAARK